MKLLEQLTQTVGIAGREHRVRALIQTRIKGLFDEVRTDALGSLICVRHPRTAGGARKRASAKDKPVRVMIAAHMDQIGFMVRHIDDKGFVRVNPVGGFDTRNLFARTCRVCPDVLNPKKDLPGVMNPGGKPLHIASEEDRKKVPEIAEFMVDMGLPAADVKKKVKIGDVVVLDGPFKQIGNTVVSQCLDNRVACWIAIRAMEKLVKQKTAHACEIVIVFTSQEEVGLRGAMTSAYAVEPDIGIAIDTTLCVDTPGVPEDQRVTMQGAGAALDLMDSSAISDLGVIDHFERVAKRRKIKLQRSLLARGGTDQGSVQRAKRGAKTMTLSCPTRYIHTITEMVHLDDLHACRDLLTAYLADVR